MKYEKYISLIQRLENYAERKPRLYRYKVLALAILGYGYFVGLIMLFLALPAIVVLGLVFSPDATLKALWGLSKLWWLLVPAAGVYFAFLGSALKSLSAQVPEPEGTPLEREQAPELFAFIDRTCKGLKAEIPRRVLISDEFNAAVITLPRFGLFGRKVYMKLGLPLMHALSTEQLEAVITHEIGHISGRHGGFAKWAHQLHDTWGRFIEVEESQEKSLSALYKDFVQWFFPYFGAYSFVLMREHEREADDYVVQTLGAKALGESLIMLELKSAVLGEKFWKNFNDQSIDSEVAPKDTFSSMLEALEKPDDPEEPGEIVRKAVSIPTDYTDTHPSLADRLRRMGYWNGEGLPAVPVTTGIRSDEHFLTAGISGYLQVFNNSWDEQVAESWKDRHEYFQKSNDRLKEIDEKGPQDDLSPEELYEKACLIAERDGASKAIPVLRSIIEKYPSYANAQLALGDVLLSEDNEEGFGLLDSAGKLDPRLRLGASESAFNYLRRKGRFEEAKPYAAIAEALYEAMEKTGEERKTVYPTDQFEPHILSEHECRDILEKLKYFEQIKAIYVARKVVQHLPEYPMHVLFMDLSPQNISRKETSYSQQTILEVTAERLKECSVHYFVVLNDEYIGLRQKLDTITNARLYARANSETGDR